MDRTSASAVNTPVGSGSPPVRNELEIGSGHLLAKFAISHHTSQDRPDRRQPKFKPAAAFSTTNVSIADRWSSVL
jgi:hypothetical protein